MTPFQDPYLLIPDYLKGDLSQEQRDRMEEALSRDLDLAGELRRQRQLYLAGRLYASNGIEAQLQALRAHPSRPPRQLKIGVYASAAVLLLLALMGVGWWLGQPSTAKKILAKAPPEELSTQVEQLKQAQGATANPARLDTLLAGLADYRAGRFLRAASHLEAYQASGPIGAEVSFYLAVAYLQVGDVQKAGVLLERAAQAPTSDVIKLYWAAWQWQHGSRDMAQRLRSDLQKSTDQQVRNLAQEEW